MQKRSPIKVAIATLVVRKVLHDSPYLRVIREASVDSFLRIVHSAVDSFNKTHPDKPMSYPPMPSRRAYPYIRTNGVNVPRPQYRPAQGKATDTGRKSIVFASTNKAQEVLEKMVEVLDKYRTVSVADLYDLAGLPSRHVDKQWGWTTVEDVKVRQVPGGYLLDLPDPQPLVNTN